MRKSRVSGTRRKSRRPSRLEQAKAEVSDEKSKLIGVSLSGGKSDKACLAVIEYFHSQKRICLARLVDRIKTEDHFSADKKIHDLLCQNVDDLKFLGFDVPLSLPTCISCKLPCPGYEVCHVDQVKWMRESHEIERKKKRPKKFITPYTQRCADFFMSGIRDDHLDVQHGLGSNLAPLTARALFIARRFAGPSYEVFPKLSLLRFGDWLKINKVYLRTYYNSAGGEEARKAILEVILSRWNIFVYQSDLRTLQESIHAFDSFITALTGLFTINKWTQAPPADFPDKEQWVEIPFENKIDKLIK